MNEPRYFHVKRPGLEPGDVLLRGSYGRHLEAQGLSELNDPLQEYLREQIRQASYPMKPSRLHSSFVFEVLDDALFFRDNWRDGCSIYEVAFSNPPLAVHRVCFTAWNDKFPNQEVQAHGFWSNPPIYSSRTELFAEEDLVVIKQV